MKFAHLADTHLGYRQFGSFEREEDFYEVFDRIVDKIIEEKVDFVIHSGDLFDNARPSPWSLFSFQKALLKLKNANIPVYAIAGNHDSVMRKKAIPPQVLFKKFGLKVISQINSTYTFGDVFIGGLPYYSSSQSKLLKNKLAELSKKAADYDKAILVLHQGIDKYFNLSYELEIGDVPDNFDYYAMGHIHNYINDDFGKGRLVYPGSTEVWKVSELEDYKKNGKGFVIVDLDGNKPSVERIKIDLPRQFVNVTMDYEDLDNGIEKVKDKIKDLENKPILDINVNNVTSTDYAHELINEELGDYSLLIRLKFSTPGEENIDLIIDQDNALGPIELLTSRLESYDDEDITKLATELYLLLSSDKIEDAEELIAKFYEEKYAVDDEEAEEV